MRHLGALGSGIINPRNNWEKFLEFTRSYTPCIPCIPWLKIIPLKRVNKTNSIQLSPYSHEKPHPSSSRCRNHSCGRLYQTTSSNREMGSS